MTTRFEIIYLIISLTAIVGYQCSELPKPSYTRASLKVSRSLPGETEEFKIRTSDGNLATLIIRKRNRSPNIEDSKSQEPSTKSSDSLGIHQEKRKTFNFSTQPNSQSWEHQAWSHDRIPAREIEQIQKIPSENIYTDRIKLENLSSPRKQVGENKDEINKIFNYGHWKPVNSYGKILKIEDFSKENSPLSKSDVSKDDTIFVSSFEEKERRRLSPSKENSPGSLIGNQDAYSFFPQAPHQLPRTNIGANLMKNRSGKDVPPEITVRSELSVKSRQKQSVLSVDVDGTPIVYGKRVADDPDDKVQIWRNARVINNKLVPNDAMSVTIEPSVLYYSSRQLQGNEGFDWLYKNPTDRSP